MKRIYLCNAIVFCVALDVTGSTSAAEKDPRQIVKLPPQMRAHMLGNMRDHLQALSEIQAALAAKQLDRAADIAETRIGMTSLASHGASHMAQHMPQGMQSAPRCITPPAASRAQLTRAMGNRCWKI